MEGDQDRKSTPEITAVIEQTVAFVFFIEPGGDDQQEGVIETVDNVMPVCAVPETHQPHVEDVADVRSGLAALEPFPFVGGEDEAVINMIAEPERQAHVPAIPKIADVAGEERQVEIFRGANAKEITEADRAVGRDT